MAKQTAWQAPTGRVRAAYRSFTEIVRDLRYCISLSFACDPLQLVGKSDNFWRRLLG